VLEARVSIQCIEATATKIKLKIVSSTTAA
jgi:hypothetical protein